MAGPGRQPGAPGGEPGERKPLSERIPEEFSNFFGDLDRIANASKLKPDDADLVERARVQLEDCERRAGNAALDDGPKAQLGQFRAAYDAAKAKIGVTPVKGETRKKGKKGDDEEGVPTKASQRRSQSQEQGGEEVPRREHWEQNFLAMDANLRVLFEGEADERARARENLLKGFTDLEAERVATLTGRQLSAAERSLDEWIQGELAQLRESFDDVERQAKHGTIIDHFLDAIDALSDEMNRVGGLPLTNAEEVAAARTALDELNGRMQEYMGDWASRVSPILDEFGQGNRPQPWRNLMSDHKNIRIYYFGDPNDNSKPGFRQDLRRELMEKSVEFGAEVWGKEFPTLQVLVMTTNLKMFDARLKEGEKRREALEEANQHLQAIEGEWKTLRRFGPRVSDADRASGKKTPVQMMDGKIRGLRKDLDRYMAAVESDRAEGFGKLRSGWRGTLAREEALWIPGSSLDERGLQVEAYISGELRAEDDENLLTLVRPEQRHNFIIITKSFVLRMARSQGRRERKEAAIEDRRARARLYHPKLEYLRLQEDDAYHEIRTARFWKRDAPRVQQKASVRAGANLSDAELEPLVTDIAQYREAFGRLEARRAAAKQLEDELVKEGGTDGTTDTRGVRAALDGYARLVRRDIQAWKRVLNTRGWKSPFSKKKARLREVYGAYRDAGPRVLEDAPPYLRGPIQEWIDERIRRDAAGTYAQWVLDENPEIAARMRGIPREFRVPIAAGAVVEGEPILDVSGVASDLDAARGEAGDEADDAVEEGAFVAHGDDSSMLGLRAAGESIADAGAAKTTVTFDAADEADAAGEVLETPRQEAIRTRETDVRRVLRDNMFWQDGASGMQRGSAVSRLLADPSARIPGDRNLRPERVADFYHAAAFESFADLEARVAAVRERIAREAAAAAAPVAPARTPEPARPSSTAEEIARGFEALAGGISEASRARIADQLARGEEVTFRRPEAVEAARRTPWLELRENEDGSVTVVRTISDGEAPRPVEAPVAPPAPEEPIVPPAPRAPEPLRSPDPVVGHIRPSASEDPFERFFRTSAAPAPAPAAPRTPESRPAAPAPRSTERAPAAPRATETPVAPPAPRSSDATRPAPVSETPAPSRRTETPPAPVERAPRVPEVLHPEERVSTWAKSVRETVGRWFGRGVGDYAATRVTGERSNYDRTGEVLDGKEALVRGAGSVLGALGTIFGFRSLATIPQYFTQSFCSANEKAHLQEEILAAMESESKTRGASDEERTRANAEASQRLERAIATSAYLSPEQRGTMQVRIAELREKYQERTRANMEAKNRELAEIIERGVTTEVTGWRAARETANSALRALTLGGFAIADAARGATIAVLGFRERFEAVAQRDRNPSMVANVATVFRETWQETWRKLTERTENVGQRALNVAEALATIGTVVGVTGMTVSALEDSFQGLRVVEGGQASGIGELVARGRAEVQGHIDRVLPGLERALRRAA